MFGKGSLLIVFSFILSFSVYQLKLSKAVTSTSDNFNQYYMRTLIHEEALNAMNFGINKVWAQNIKSDTFSIVANGCTSVVNICESGLDTVLLRSKSWNYIFDEDYYASNKKTKKVEDSVLAYFAYNIPISRYFWFTNEEGNIYWITGDSVWGPIHTNSVIKTYGSPVFYGKVTAQKGISPNPSLPSNNAKFYGGWEVGPKIEIPTDMTHLMQAAFVGNGPAPPNTKCIYDKETMFNFLADGRVERTVGATSPDTVYVSDIAPTGVIFSAKDVRVKGTLNGKLTIYSDDDIWIDDDIVYANDPEIDPNSDDILGLIAKDKVIVTDNAPNRNDVNIQACIMAASGSFTAQNYSTRPVSGVLKITGGIVQHRRGAIGTFGWSGIKSGFSKCYKFDNRCSTTSPPSYPYVRVLHLVSWWE